LNTKIHKTKEKHYSTGHSMLIHNGYQKKTPSTQTSHLRGSVEEHEQEQEHKCAKMFNCFVGSYCNRAIVLFARKSVAVFTEMQTHLTLHIKAVCCISFAS
jgi:hypothetical protein